jgi:hypothetical protein
VTSRSLTFHTSVATSFVTRTGTLATVFAPSYVFATTAFDALPALAIGFGMASALALKPIASNRASQSFVDVADLKNIFWPPSPPAHSAFWRVGFAGYWHAKLSLVFGYA